MSLTRVLSVRFTRKTKNKHHHDALIDSSWQFYLHDRLSGVARLFARKFQAAPPRAARYRLSVLEYCNNIWYRIVGGIKYKQMWIEIHSHAPRGCRIVVVVVPGSINKLYENQTKLSGGTKKKKNHHLLCRRRRRFISLGDSVIPSFEWCTP